MQLRFGSYTHEDGEVSIAIDAQARETQSGIPYLNIERWAISGMLVGTQGLDGEALIADLATKIQALKDAYQQTGVDLALLGTNHVLSDAATLSGIKVVKPPFFPNGTNAEHVTYRTYQIVVEAETLVDPNGEILLAYEERIQTFGGGPERVRTRPLFGQPTWQRARQYTDYHAIQSGSAVGVNFTPKAPRAYWPGDLIEQNPRTMSGRLMTTDRQRMVTWEYSFARNTPFGGMFIEIPEPPGLFRSFGR